MGDKSSLMLFSVREFVFAVEVGDLLEVAEISAEKISAVDGGALKYRFDFRGNDIPVVDMASRICDIPTPLAGLLHLLVVEIDSHPIALMIDTVLEVVKGTGIVYRFPDMLRTEENRYIKAIYRLDNRMYLNLQAASLLKNDEIAELRAF